MKRSTERILTTHTGSLPRPDDLLQMMRAKEDGELRDMQAFESRVRSAVAETVREQVAAGIDIVNDGEMGKPGYSTYVKDRLSGFGGESGVLAGRLRDIAEFPQYAARMFGSGPAATLKTPACNGPIAYQDKREVERDIDNLKAALQGLEPAEVFVSAASPGVISLFLNNRHYPSHEAYLAALADAMKAEYDAIHRAGFILQVDCPDLAMGRHIQFADLSVADFRKQASLHVEALNHALADVPPDGVRMHLCWGNYEGPHHRDVALEDIVDIVLRARPAAISFVASNPRHEHEWKVWEKVKLPDGKILIPGVLDSTTNFIEHPELVAERLLRFARLAGRENVIAGTDCGFSTFAGYLQVDPGIIWAKFRAMADGAGIASRALWRHGPRPAGRVGSGARARARARAKAGAPRGGAARGRKRK